MVGGNDNRPVAQDVGKTVEMDKNAESEKPAKGIPIKPVDRPKLNESDPPRLKKRLVKRGAVGGKLRGTERVKVE